jgi:hypothetical protein
LVENHRWAVVQLAVVFEGKPSTTVRVLGTAESLDDAAALVRHVVGNLGQLPETWAPLDPLHPLLETRARSEPETRARSASETHLAFGISSGAGNPSDVRLSATQSTCTTSFAAVTDAFVLFDLVDGRPRKALCLGDDAAAVPLGASLLLHQPQAQRPSSPPLAVVQALGRRCPPPPRWSIGFGPCFSDPLLLGPTTLYRANATTDATTLYRANANANAHDRAHDKVRGRGHGGSHHSRDVWEGQWVVATAAAAPVASRESFHGSSNGSHRSRIRPTKRPPTFADVFRADDDAARLNGQGLVSSAPSSEAGLEAASSASSGPWAFVTVEMAGARREVIGQGHRFAAAASRQDGGPGEIAAHVALLDSLRSIQRPFRDGRRNAQMPIQHDCFERTIGLGRRAVPKVLSV